MTVLVANTANTNLFSYWRARTNELAYAMSTYAVTTDSNTAVGNAAITGTFTANAYVANTANIASVYIGTSIILGNTTVTNPNTTQANGSHWLNGNGQFATLPPSAVVAGSNTQIQYNANNGLGGSAAFTWNTSSNTMTVNGAIAVNAALIQTSRTTLVSNSQTTLDSFLMSSYRGAKYLVTIKDTTSNSHSITELLAIHNDGAAVLTESGGLSTNTTLGTFDASANATHLQLLFTPVPSGSVVTLVRTAVAI